MMKISRQHDRCQACHLVDPLQDQSDDAGRKIPANAEKALRTPLLDCAENDMHRGEERIFSAGRTIEASE